MQPQASNPLSTLTKKSSKLQLLATVKKFSKSIRGKYHITISHSQSMYGLYCGIAGEASFKDNFSNTSLGTLRVIGLVAEGNVLPNVLLQGYIGVEHTKESCARSQPEGYM